MKKLFIFIFIGLNFYNVFSRNNIDISNTGKKPSSLSSRAGNCVLGKASIDLDINNVRARLNNTGDLFWDRSKGKYGVPKLSPDQILSGQTQVIPLFAGSIWISGKENGNLKMAALEYSGSTGAQSFWPGPLKTNFSTMNREVCNRFDNFWSVKSDDIKNAIADPNNLPTAIKEWPGKGNKYLIANKGFTAEDLSEDLAPFYDVSGDNIYEPEKGDLPAIKYTDATVPGAVHAYGAQMIFWVINDYGNEHAVPSATPIGLQLNCLAFAFQSSDDLNNMTFYTYDIRNKSNTALDQTYMSQWMDVDLGNWADDYIGCDTSRALGYIYNSDIYDDDFSGGGVGYHENLPVFGADFFEGPKDQAGKNIGMSSFVYMLIASAGDPEFIDPTTSIEFRNFQEGKTRLGNNLTTSSNCRQAGFPTTKYCYTGNPYKPTEWSMCSAALPPRDVRFVQNSGPFTMEPGSKETITVGLVFVQPGVGSQTGCGANLEASLFAADEQAQRLFDFGFKNTAGPDAPNLKIQETNKELHITIQNDKGSNNVGESYFEKDTKIPSGGGIKDSGYKFEGYLVYQVLAPSEISTFKDLKNDAKAKLIKKMDLINDVDTAVNFKFSNVNGQNITFIDEMITFDNNGIEKEFIVTNDLFESEGQKKLVNNKTYYFAAVAVGYNNYFDPNTKKRQERQLIVSPVIKVFSATPHNDDFWGLKANSKFGQKIDVKRISGQGHGNYFLEMIGVDKKEIVTNGDKSDPTYLGGYAPISVRVNDPLSVRNAKFKLTLTDNNANPKYFNTTTSNWSLEIMENGVSSTVLSESNIDREFSQSIYSQIGSKLENYGISVGLSKVPELDSVARTKNPIYGIVGSSLTFNDESKKWLNLVKDKNGTEEITSGGELDWIRSGITNSPNQKLSSSYNIIGTNKKVFNDSLKLYTNIVEGKVSPYCLAANTNILSNTSAANSYISNTPGFKWRRLTNDSTTMATWGEGPENNLDSIYSVDIVMTNDRSMWSQCVVLETGENTQFNEGGAIKGQMRKTSSVDSFGNQDLSENGRGWFPGYAINLETGVRMNIYFGENSQFRGKGGANMVWDPDSILSTSFGSAIHGGSQFVYVTNTKYDGGLADQAILRDNFNVTVGSGNARTLSPIVAKFYRTLAWTFMPYLNNKFSFYDSNGKYVIPTETTIKVRVRKPYAYYLSSSESVYEFSTEGLAPASSDSLIKSAFDKMAIVPNPYNAYSIYEVNPAQNKVKLVNVPKNSKISIFTTDGILVRKINLDNSNLINTYSGANANESNIDNSIDWDLRTSSGVLIASGVYYINVESPGLGTKVLKLFATMRSVDVSNF